MALNWENLGKEALPPGGTFPWMVETWRSRVPGGWLVLTIKDSGNKDISLSTTFMPDPEHKWNGGALPVVGGLPADWGK